jgi:hypothetical protein
LNLGLRNFGLLHDEESAAAITFNASGLEGHASSGSSANLASGWEKLI